MSNVAPPNLINMTICLNFPDNFWVEDHILLKVLDTLDSNAQEPRSQIKYDSLCPGAFPI